ncbi:MAG TPA: YihY/virulence factor BrkB family protein [Bauldia sp.]|nr:YihY/virulence factor BrkB family protein [Bauldia sp.]
MSFFRQARAVLGDALGHLNDDDGWAMASHVALSALMAVFPFLIFVAALAGFIGEADLASRVASLLFETWPKDVAEPIADDVQKVLRQPHSGLLTLSVAITIYLASNGVEAVRTALNRAYRVRESRSFFFLRAQSLLFVIAGAVASLVFAFLGVLGPLLFDWIARYVPEISPFQTTFLFLRLIVTGFMLAVVLVAAHIWLPAGRPPASSLWPGIVMTLALWLLAAWVFGYYLQRFADYAAYYAGLASVVTAIFFMYLVALIMIFGAEFNAALARRREP